MSQVRNSRHLSVAAIVLLVIALLFLPASPAGAEERERRPDIVIKTAFDFNLDHGVRSGSGTESDPYVISGWDVNNLRISDTDAYVVITNVTVRNQMVLNWIGDRVHVFGNDIHDLRVNQNVRRTGDSTSGMIHDNSFDLVGQLRHWDGVFSNNVVGRNNGDPFAGLFGSRAVNFDGFNGARFTNNTIYGYMDARLHGHHHSSQFGETSHYHGPPAAAHEHGEPSEEHPEDHSMVDHSQRYHEVWITNNTITAQGSYALQYVDTGHSGNDRTNGGSEQDEALNGPHIHYTRVHINDNKLIGSGLRINTFNANDPNHTGTAPGLVDVKRNDITLRDTDAYPFGSSTPGISANTAKDVTLRIIDNRIEFEQRDFDPGNLEQNLDGGAGIDLRDFDIGSVYLYGNYVANRYYGIRASRFSETVHWYIDTLQTSGVTETVYWDQSVHNPPQQKEG
ncbi:MAG TPA: hypothetical protein VHJ82_08195 [Actinomycetota bacterium]|nr:hypothetical protein [Actinomycetota bacterium]